MVGRAVIRAAGITGEHALTVTLSAHTESTQNLITGHHFGLVDETGSRSLRESPAARINCD